MSDLLIWTALIFVLLLTLASFVFSTFGLMFLFGAPWVPTPKAVARDMLTFAGLKYGQTIADLGSGDGAILIVALKEFGAAKAIGYELHPVLNLIARMRARWHGVSDRLEIHNVNIFKEPVQHTDVVTTYLLEGTMDKLRPKLAKELHADTVFVSRGFRLTGLEPQEVKRGKESAFFRYRVQDL